MKEDLFALLSSEATSERTDSVLLVICMILVMVVL